MERKTSRQIQAENTKQTLLDTITEMLNEYTYDRISIQEISRRAGVSVGTFYHYFENKASIIVELYRDCDEYFQHEVLDSCLKDEPVDAILHYADSMVVYAEDLGIDMMRNIYKAQVDNGNEFFLSVGRGLPQGLRTLVERAGDEGALLPDTDRDTLTSDLLTLIRGVVYNWCVAEGRLEMQKVTRRMVGNYLRPHMN